MKALKRVGSVAFAVMLCVALIVGCSSKERVTLRVEVFDRGNSPEGMTVTNNLMTKYVQENFGDPNNIDVEFVAVPRSEEINNLNVLMAAGTAPDIIFTYNAGAVYSWAQQGGLMDLGACIQMY